MMSAWPVIPSTARAPRWRILVGGVALSGCESIEVHQTNDRKASTLSARFALASDHDGLAGEL